MFCVFCSVPASVKPSSTNMSTTPTPQMFQRDLARTMAERLVQSAILAGARDNISVTVVLLPGAGV